MNAVFPLLRLPPDERTNVLKSMDLMELVSFSLISKATKSLVVGINFGVNIIIKIERRFEVELAYVSLFFDHDLDKGLFLTDTIEVSDENNDFHKWTKAGFDMEDWLKHLMDITHQVAIESVHFHWESEWFDFSSLVKTMNAIKVDHFEIEMDCRFDFGLLLIRSIQMDSIWWHEDPCDDESMHIILMHHFEKYTVIDQCRKESLNDLLVTNARRIWFYENKVFEMKKYNRFLKLWKKGFSGRLTVVEVTTGFVPDKNVILKGIEYFEIDPKDAHPMRPKPSDNISQELEVYDIHGSGGRRATLYISLLDRMGVEFCVWK